MPAKMACADFRQRFRVMAPFLERRQRLPAHSAQDLLCIGPTYMQQSHVAAAVGQLHLLADQVMTEVVENALRLARLTIEPDHVPVAVANMTHTDVSDDLRL